MISPALARWRWAYLGSAMLKPAKSLIKRLIWVIATCERTLNVLWVLSIELKLALPFFCTPNFFSVWKIFPQWKVSFTALEICIFVDNSLA